MLTAPRGLTQPTTSFIGSWRQGIPRTPFLAQRAHLVRHSRQAGRIGSISLIVDVNHSSVVKVLGAGSPSCSSHHALPGANKNGLAPARPPRLHSDETTPWSGTLVLSRWRACLQLDAPAFFRSAALTATEAHCTASHTRVPSTWARIFGHCPLFDSGCGWAFLGSNQGPQSYQDCALTS